MDEIVTGYQDLVSYPDPPEMEMVSLGNRGLSISEVGLGTWPLGGLKWGEISDENAIETLHEALDRDINFFDTSPLYGKGHCEKLLGYVVKERRDEMVIATKGGLQLQEDGTYDTDYRPEALRKQFDASRNRLGIEVIDLYMLHWPAPRMAIKPVYDFLMELLQGGKIRAIGLCHFPPKLVESFLEQGPIDALQVRYNMLQREAEEHLIPLCQEEDVSILTCSSLGKGLLTGKYESPPNYQQPDNRAGDPLFQAGTLRNGMECSQQLLDLCREHSEYPLSALVLQWILDQEGITCSLAGARSPAQVKQNAMGSGWELSDTLRDELEDVLEEYERNTST